MDEKVLSTHILPTAKGIIAEVKKAVIGKDEIIVKTLLAIIAGGHILLDDIPGVGKTTLALAFSKAMSLSYKRMQFTPDVLPADVVGFNVFNKQTNRFEYKEGAAVCNMFLADEINRTSSKTQSALLEVMEEGAVTVDGVTRVLPKPYIVMATQNPIGSVGTQMLPESQIDRFIVRLTMGYPDTESEVLILKSKCGVNPLESINPVADDRDITVMRNFAETVFVDDRIYKYMADISRETRHSEHIKLGVSPRGTVSLCAMARAAAIIRGRTFVIPDDINYVIRDVLEHRILLTAKARAQGTDVRSLLKSIAAGIPAPKI